MALKAFFIVVAIVAFALGCSQTRTVETPAPPIDTTRISHSQHTQVHCETCHIEGTRPGSNDHAPCDTCHKDAFLAKPGPLCKTCHTKVTDAPVTAPLRPYPVEDVWQAEPPRFSHKLHMDFNRMESGVGFHVTCVDCHVRDGKLARANHATCSRCHAPEAKLANAPAMGNCDGCHKKGLHERVRQRLIKGDLLPFDHERHRNDQRGTPIRCEECHATSAESTSYADHAAPHVENCVGCHDDSTRTPETQRMRICQTCHTERQQNLTTIAPRSHLPASERPIDHTLAFRRDHAEQAEHNGARCAACHTQMSGNPRDACDECHQTMRPVDHTITFRELDHGTEAAANRDRCARCHVIEFCSACHSQRPRSHGFPGSFMQVHGGLARLNVRSCMTCHDQGTFCANCHTVRASP